MHPSSLIVNEVPSIPLRRSTRTTFSSTRLTDYVCYNVVHDYENISDCYHTFTNMSINNTSQDAHCVHHVTVEDRLNLKIHEPLFYNQAKGNPL